MHFDIFRQKLFPQYPEPVIEKLCVAVCLVSTFKIQTEKLQRYLTGTYFYLYFQARKPENRFHVPMGTKFYRVKCRPVDRIKTSTLEVLQLTGYKPLHYSGRFSSCSDRNVHDGGSLVDRIETFLVWAFERTAWNLFSGDFLLSTLKPSLWKNTCAPSINLQGEGSGSTRPIFGCKSISKSWIIWQFFFGGGDKGVT